MPQPPYLSQVTPTTILHIDGDSFFVSCELTRKPYLRGRPVVTGLERGIASAMSPEAKARGIYRGMRIGEMRKVCPDVVILPSDYDMYAQYARRMYSIVRRYAEVVEEYSIDECFADLSRRSPEPARDGGGLSRRSASEGGSLPHRSSVEGGSQSYPNLARRIQEDIHASLGLTVSVGLSVTKVLAKVASKWNKPRGFTVIAHGDIPAYLRQLPIGKVWGIGSSTTQYLRKLGITTALDLAEKDHVWISEHCDLPVARIYQELRGVQGRALVDTRDSRSDLADYASVQRTRTFRPTSSDREFCWSQLSQHVEDACIHLRRDGMVAGKVSFFLKTKDFEYIGEEVTLPEATAEPQLILRALRPRLDKLFAPGIQYRTTGVTLFSLRPRGTRTESLFGDSPHLTTSTVITETVDRLARKYGRGTVTLASSLRAATHDDAEYRRNRRGHDATSPQGRGRKLLKRHFDLIYLGEVK